MNDEGESDPDKTPVVCLACGGNWQRTVSNGHGQHATIACRWCVQGAMSERGVKRWREYREKKKRGG